MLVAAMGKSTDRHALDTLTQGLLTVSGRLDAVAAAKVADMLVAAMEETTDPNALNQLSQGLWAVSGRLDAARAPKVADALVAVMSKTNDPNAFRYLLQGLRAVSSHLDAAAAVKSAEALVAALSKTTDPDALSWLSKELQAVSERLTTPDLIAVLRHPLAGIIHQRPRCDPPNCSAWPICTLNGGRQPAKAHRPLTPRRLDELSIASSGPEVSHGRTA
jgi:hypothetical protein